MKPKPNRKKTKAVPRQLMKPDDPMLVSDVSRGLQRALCLLREGQDEAFMYEVAVTLGIYVNTDRARSRIRRTFHRVHKEGGA
jgi:hypothetical protein